MTNSSFANYTVTNSRVVEYTSINVTKVWDDDNDHDGFRPVNVTFVLNANDKYYANVTLSGDGNTWTGSFTDLPVYANGSAIVYSIKELKVPDYNSSVTNSSLANYTITNSRIIEYTEITVTKVWNDSDNHDGFRPAFINFVLLADGNFTDHVVLNGTGNVWSFTFIHMPVYRDGKAIVYSVVEFNVTHYNSTVTNSSLANFTITNTRIVEYTSVNVTKVWNDSNNQDGIRPEFVTVQLLADGTVNSTVVLNKTNNWKGSFTGLPVYKNGKAVNYTVIELDVVGYDINITNNEAGNFTITNTHVPYLTSVNVTKVWNDNDNKDGFRPANVIVILLADGKEVNRTVLSNATGWKFTFADLPLRKNGTDINYTVNETPVDNYSVNITDLGDGRFLINNTQIVKVCDLEIKKLVNASDVYVNDLVEWTIVVVNNGPCDALDVFVNDTLPDGIKIISSSKEYKRVGNSLIWNVGDLVAYQNISIVIVTQVQKEGQIDNFVTVNTTTNETNNTNNKANNTTYANPICDLAISKVVNSSNIYVNECVEWNVTVINYGPSTAMDVEVKDTLPKGVELISANPSSGTFDKDSKIWKIDELKVNESVSLVLVTKVLIDGNVTNAVVANTTTNETNTSNNKANNTTVADPICDLIISKSVNASSIDVGDIVEWTINVINVGPSKALDVEVKDTLPKGVIILSATPSTGNFNKDTRVWKIGELKANEPVSLILVTQVLMEGNITNVVSVNTTTYEPNKTNNEANNTTLANPICDLEISKIVNASSVYINGFVEWTVVVVNHGPSVAGGVAVNDTLPQGLVLVSATPSVGRYENGIWTIGDLEKDTLVHLVLVTQAVGEGNITNVASVNSTTPDKNTTNNVANNTTEVKPVCDLEIAKYVNASSVNVTDLVEWTIVVVNHGPSVAKDVVVSDDLLEGLKLISAVPSVGNYKNGIWSVGDLGKDVSASLVLITQAVKDGNITNVVTVNSTTPDSNGTNNKDNNTTEVKPVCDLEIIKLVSAEKAYVGEELTWTIIVKNHGPSAASNVKVREDIPSTLKFIRATGTKGTYDAKTQVWTIGTLESGSTVSLQIVTKVLSVGNITNPVEATTTTTDSNKSNNRANNTTEGIASVDLGVVKYADKDIYHVNDTIRWIITVTNYGPCDAHNVTATDYLPSVCEFIGCSASKGSYDVSTGIWAIGNLTNGESATLEIICKALAEGQITNVVNVTCSEHDPNLDNNHDSVTVSVVNDTPEPEPEVPEVPVTLWQTGNPIAYLVIALFAIFASFRSKGRKE